MAVPAVPGEWVYTPLGEEQIRWFWIKVPFSLKAVYQLDIPHRAQLLRFCDTDNSRLEKCYREQATAIERAWWEEQAQFATGPAGKEQAKDNLTENEEASVSWQDHILGDGKQEPPGTLVRSGHYEVDFIRRRMQPCYWPGSRHRVLRGAWFLQKGADWVPLKEAVADELEEAYRSGVWLPERGRLTDFHGTKAARVELLTHANEMKGMFALFVDANTFYLTKDDSAFTWLSRKWKDAADIGSRLCRGYPGPVATEGSTSAALASNQIDARAEEADNAASLTPIGRLLLVVHGIGQNLSGSNIAGDADAVRNNLFDLAHDALPDEARDGMRTEVLPVQWRKHLALDLDVIAEALMPPGVRSLRTMLHATAVEVLLSLTPLHAQDMLDSLIGFLNAQHAKFMARNPTFQGTVSVMAHSLGSVLMWDILCSQPQLQAALGDLPPSLQPVAPIASATLQQQPDQLRTRLPPPIQVTSPSRLSEPRISADLIDLSCITSPGHSNPASPPSAFQPSPSPFPSARPSPNASSSELQAEGQEGDAGHIAWGRPEGEGGQVQELAGRLTAPVEIRPLSFAVDQFIVVGSPLGLFLALRKVNPSKGRGLGTPAAAHLMQGGAAQAGDGLPAVRRMYNLYHPFDPVAYRMEPLIAAGAEKRRPVYAALAAGGRRLHVGLAEFSEDVSAAASRASNALFSGLRMGGGAVAKAVTVQRAEAKEGEGRGSKEGAKQHEEEAAEEAAFRAGPSQADPKTRVWRLTDGPGSKSSSSSRLAAGRIDFVLQAGNVENPWLSAMSSHFAYWASPDTALFVLRALHGLDVRTGSPIDGGLVRRSGDPAGVASPRVMSPLTSPRASGTPQSGL